MRRWMIVTLCAIGALTSLPVAAAPALCPSGATLQALIDLGSCAIGDKVFSAFAVAPGTFQGLSELDFAASDVVVTVDSTPLDPGLAFTFSPALGIGRDQLLLGAIDFTVTVSSNGAPIDGFALTDAATALGAAFVGVSAILDNSAFAGLVTNAAQGTEACTAACVPGSVAVLSLTPATTLAFASDIVLNDNAASDPNPQGATLSSFTVHFAELPEPPTLALLGAGLASVGFARRRRLI